MSEDRLKTPRTLLIADHIWDAFSTMAAEMGSDRDGLVNEALYTFARMNGFLGNADREARDEAPTDTVLPRVEGDPAPARVLLSGGEELERVAKDRFLIGRGKHCDLVISSAKVSREHAAIVREGPAWFIEDLGSSNGTWFDAERITRRQIHDGDEYYISSQKLSCALR